MGGFRASRSSIFQIYCAFRSEAGRPAREEIRWHADLPRHRFGGQLPIGAAGAGVQAVSGAVGRAKQMTERRLHFELPVAKWEIKSIRAGVTCPCQTCHGGFHLKRLSFQRIRVDSLQGGV